MKKSYEILRKGVGYKVYNGYITQLLGEDVEETLNRVLPKNIEFLDVNTCGYTFLLNDNGEVYSEIVYYKLEDSYILFSNKKIEDYFSYVEKDVVMKDLTDEKVCVQIEGKESPSVAQQFYDYDISTLNFRSLFQATYKDTEILLARFGYSGEFGYQFLLNKDDMVEFQEEVLTEILNYDESLENYLKFEVGHPLEELYFSEKTNLFTLGYSWNLDFTKETFQGKDIMLNYAATATVQSVGFECEKPVAQGEAVYFDGEEIGKVLWLEKSLSDEPKRQYIGMLLLEQYFVHSGIHFITKDNVVLTTLSNPYTIPESWKK